MRCLNVLSFLLSEINDTDVTHALKINLPVFDPKSPLAATFALIFSCVSFIYLFILSCLPLIVDIWSPFPSLIPDVDASKQEKYFSEPRILIYYDSAGGEGEYISRNRFPNIHVKTKKGKFTVKCEFYLGTYNKGSVVYD